MLYTNQLPSLDTFVKKLIFFFTIVILSVPIADALLTFSLPKKDSIPSFLTFSWIAIWVFQGFSILMGILGLFTLMIGYVMVMEHLFRKKVPIKPIEKVTSKSQKSKKPRKPYQRRSYKKKRRERYTRKIN